MQACTQYIRASAGKNTKKNMKEKQNCYKRFSGEGFKDGFMYTILN